jgi:AmpD protein
MLDWLPGARRADSPNHEPRPPGTEISLLVIHGISLPPGKFGGPYIDALFGNTLDPSAHPFFAQLAGVRVSAHLLIRRDGETVQYVPFSRRAWHAGVSRFQGRERCNDFSIGIELEGTDDFPYSAAQYHRLAEIIGILRQHWPAISPSRIVGHSDIAPGRKTDPGPSFDWEKLRRLIKAENRSEI